MKKITILVLTIFVLSFIGKSVKAQTVKVPYRYLPAINMDSIVDGSIYKKYSSTEKTKLSGIEVGSEKNVQADFTETNTESDAYIKNKSSILYVTDTLRHGKVTSYYYVDSLMNSFIGGWTVGTTTITTNKDIIVSKTSTDAYLQVTSSVLYNSKLKNHYSTSPYGRGSTSLLNQDNFGIVMGYIGLYGLGICNGSASPSYYMPTSVGTAGQVLTTGGAFGGVLYWSAGGGSGSGTVTSVSAGNGMSFTTITTTGAVTMGTPSSISSTSTNSVSTGTHTHALSNTAVTAGAYTNTNLTVDAQGRITAAANGTTGGYTLPTASDDAKGGIKTSTTGGTVMIGEYMAMVDNRLNTDVPTLFDYIGFWDVSGSDQNKVTIGNLAALVGSGITVQESDGSPIVSNVSTLKFSGATVTDNGSGTATVLISGGGEMVYPSAGIPISTGSAWGTSITNNSTNWDAAYNDKINSLAVTGTTTKTITLTQQDGGTVSGTFTDLQGSGATNLSTTYGSTSITINSDTGTDATINTGNSTTAGALSTTLYDNIIANNAKVTNATHTGEVTGSGALTIADNVVDEANLKASNSPSNTDILTYNSSTGGFTWIATTSVTNKTPQSITTTADCTTYYNFYTTASTDKTITLTNIPNGTSGQIVVTYSGAGKITFASSGFTVKISSSIYDSAGTVITKSSGSAVYSFYADQSILYINGTQSYE